MVAVQQSKDSTTSTMNKRSPLAPSTISKKMKIDNDDQKQDEEKEGKDKIPNYLSVSHRNFQQLMQSILSTTANSFNIEDLQEIALLIRKIAMIDLQKSLWTSYLRSGTGKLEKDRPSTANHYVSVWPLEVKKSIMMKEKNTMSEMTPININQIDNNACLNHVYQTLLRFVDSRIEYQNKLDEKKYHLKNFFTSKMEDAIVQFIEQQEMVFIRLEIESKIAIVEYDYKDRWIEFEYNQLEPNQYQVRFSEIQSFLFAYILLYYFI
jgi:hypothetical protein